MRTAIEGKIRDWQAGTEHLQGRRLRLAAELKEIDAQVQMNLGAIRGAEEILLLLAAPETVEGTAAEDLPAETSLPDDLPAG
jgi:hypothetical protein